LYFVTELRGKVKVVTNDRSVYTFAEDFFTLAPRAELPSFGGEMGMAGLCLDPASGYVFVTFTYQDEKGILRNNIVRFESEPGVFSLKPVSSLAFTEIFADEQSAPSHQIGPCQVYDNNLYVGLGDAFTTGGVRMKSQDINSLLGKVLRMTLDGKPVETNPYYVDEDIKTARNYVWASGFRNPFGLGIADGRVFVADNGKEADRFIEVREGGNYRWNGSDLSITTNASVVFFPAQGVAQMDFLKAGGEAFPKEFTGKFYLSLSGDPDTDPVTDSGRGVMMLDYDFADDELAAVPDYFVRYRGSSFQVLAGLAAGPDGLYIAPILPFKDGRSAILKVRYAGPGAHPHTFGNETDPQLLLESRGCYGCHTLGENGWGTAGPSLDRNELVGRLKDRLLSEAYVQNTIELDSLDAEPYKNYKDARKEVLKKHGMDRVKLWVKYHILEPRFDNPYSTMPNMGLTADEAAAITDFLIGEDTSFQSEAKRAAWDSITTYIPELRYRHLLYSFLIGLGLALVMSFVFFARAKKR
ncbi:MAG: PQQ-dependent sugar dehydrogenase, partial [Candidatus Dadabacteria bacterium]|nr:PQQ-dependent sugar dehydrogenase [Candidatus Dadabacteria bacterium]